MPRTKGAKNRYKGPSVFRYGMLTDLKNAIGDAYAMQGAGDPETMEERRAAIAALGVEVLRHLQDYAVILKAIQAAQASNRRVK